MTLYKDLLYVERPELRNIMLCSITPLYLCFASYGDLKIGVFSWVESTPLRC